MKLNMIFLIGFATGIVGCAEKEQGAPEQAGEMPPAVSAVEPEATPAQIEDWRASNFLDHMHAHAEHLDVLNFALDDGDLEQARTPAYWLSRHKTVSGLPTDLQPFVERMREAAQAVEEAEDLVAARAAAQRINTECQGCHAALKVAAR